MCGQALANFYLQDEGSKIGTGGQEYWGPAYPHPSSLIGQKLHARRGQLTDFREETQRFFSYGERQFIRKESSSSKGSFSEALPKATDFI